MEVEQVISAVYRRPSIWDRNSKEYHNRVLTEKYWDQICKEVHEKKDKVKKKWKGLRDTYRFELRKYLFLNAEHFKNKNVEKEYEPTWPFFKSLSFLRRHINIRADSNKIGKKSGNTSTVNNGINENENSNDLNSSLSNLQNEIFELDSSSSNDSIIIEVPKKEVSENNDENNDEIDIKPVILDINDHLNVEINIRKDEEHDNQLQNNKSIDNNNNSNLNGRKRKWHEIGEKIIDLEHEKINLLKEQKNDEHIHSSDNNNCEITTIRNESDIDNEDKSFFNSLLPHIKNLKPAKKLKCRMDIQKIIYDYCYDNK